MQIEHSQAPPLTEEQMQVLLRFRQRLDAMVSNHGLTASDIKQLVRELKAHPLISVPLMQEIRDELGRLLPGQRFTFDWD